MQYDVVVGNVGTVYSGHSYIKATDCYREYVSQSKTNYGRAAGEPVTLLRYFKGAGDVIAEYAGTLPAED